jgi:DNA-binding IclR family transcriptional regulator
MKDSIPRYSIPNLANACRVLKWLSTEDTPRTVSEISRLTEIPRTTALRIISTLAHEALLRETPEGFVLGPALVPLGAKALDTIDLRRTAAPILRQLSLDTDETAHLAVPLEGFKSLLVEVAQSPHPIRVGAPAGTLTELYCSATGKIFLAHCYKNQLPEYFASVRIEKRTPHTLTTLPAMEAELDTILARHYAMDEQEYNEGIRCMAVPVLDNRGAVSAALGITGPASRFTDAKIQGFADLLTRASARLTRDLGGALNQQITQ